MAKYIQEPKDARVFVPAKHIKCNARALIEEANSGAKNFSMLRSEFEIGGYAEPHTHTFEQGYYILKGKGLVTIGDEEYKVKPGNSVLFPPNVVHSIKNTGNTPLWLIAVNSPPK
jgi:quercetin dioxygenase-like cupin family protein